tara:strand:- start:101 stop:700 length:600 start_codon:yes stop_codon:yes gene_type:complete
VDSNYKTCNIFPIPIHCFDINEFDEVQNKLIDYAYNLREKDSVGNYVSNRGGWQSHPIHIKNTDDILHNVLINTLKNFPNIKTHVKFRLIAWININGNGNFNATHCHPMSNLASALWVKCPKNCGDIEFVSPYQYSAFEEIESYTDEFKENNFLYQNVHFQSIEGRMLVFPSHLFHLVNSNESQEDRISISCNIEFIKN